MFVCRYKVDRSNALVEAWARDTTLLDLIEQVTGRVEFMHELEWNVIFATASICADLGV